MARRFSQDHARSIVPQMRDTQGQFRPKPSAKRPVRVRNGVYPAQQLPTMLTNNNGAIGESS